MPESETPVQGPLRFAQPPSVPEPTAADAPPPIETRAGFAQVILGLLARLDAAEARIRTLATVPEPPGAPPPVTVVGPSPPHSPVDRKDFNGASVLVSGAFTQAKKLGTPIGATIVSMLNTAVQELAAFEDLLDKHDEEH